MGPSFSETIDTSRLWLHRVHGGNFCLTFCRRIHKVNYFPSRQQTMPETTMTRSIPALLCTLSWLLTSTPLHAQGYGITSLKGGYLSPKDAQGGPMFGVTWGRAVDDRVDLGIALDFFRKRYVRETVVLEDDLSSGVHERQVLRELEYTTMIVPLMATINVGLPSNRVFGYYATAGVGGEFLFNSEKNYVANVSESRFYKGLAWLVGGGVYYKLSRSTAVIGEVLYQSSKVSRENSSTEAGLPIRREVNLSGFGVRGGLRFGIW